MREYFLVCVVAAAITFATTPMVRALAIRVGAVTAVRARDVHTHPIPRLGGVAMFLGFVGATVVAGRLPHLSQIFESPEMRGVLIGAAIVTAVGALDDVTELDWLTKLAGQTIAAGAMAFFGVQLLSLPLFGVTVLPGPVLIGLTVVIVLVSTNAVNFIDGLDGLAAGIVAIASLAFFLYAYQLSYTFDPPNVMSTATFITAATLGACLGFLPHNFNPARLFMGDSGSLLLGLLLAATTISMVGNIDPSAQVNANAQVALYLPIALPLAVMSIPLLDMTLAVVRRTRRGQRPWTPDAQHLQHRMLHIGHTHRRAVLLLYLWAGIVAFGVVSFAFVDGFWPVAAIAVAVLVALLLTAKLPDWLDRRASRARAAGAAPAGERRR
ncbi:MraY family glycosyltransferase [Agilicoccus flavus]|uniref:MraY family glycosyltransferase n=1 Tax=Agilicoccus flavus TaxID=2775968 RepID=UPI001CF70ED4|nr:MraY family glycosyltransferase [Agilicoccus flavus]